MISTTPPNAYEFQYDGKLKTLYGIFMRTFLLRIFTLGIYSFWGKTRLRQYFASSFQINNDRFEYSGTALELFKGFLKALVFFLLPFVVLEAGLSFFFTYLQQLDMSHTMNTIAIIGQTTIAMLPYLFIFLGVIYSRYAFFRYMSSRIQWRGIGFKLTATFSRYFLLIVKNNFMNIITLGLRIPKSDHASTQYFSNTLFLGNSHFTFDGNPKELFSINLKTLLLSIFTLGASRFWYQAALNRYRFKHLKLGDIEFSCSQTGYQLFKLYLGNLLILALTLGFGIPIIYHRKAKLLSRSMTVIGDLNNLQIKQTTKDKVSATGEELSGFFESDLDVAFF